ncbi:MAG: 3-deoxy-manno-octulosonate cytidylyltransferase [Kangiellaceae bacterium]|nr:3-deoxy-manno-octulosonate cytidylyltransferase [Kangiellaceae bacterium]
MTFHVIIPARFQSTRLPGKPLAKIGGKEMILHVCERAAGSGAESVTVATDNEKIQTVVNQAGFKAVLTRDDHQSGSDRIFEAAELLGLKNDDVIVNVQGDEPFIPSKNIVQVASIINNKKAQMETLCCSFLDKSEAENPNAVKVIFDNNNRAIYFSRALIPYDRNKSDSNHEALNYFRHIGIYAYTKIFLKRYIHWPISELESCEKLEQLRVLENGEAIYLELLKDAPQAGIDTAEDLARANLIYQKKSQ